MPSELAPRSSQESAGAALATNPDRLTRAPQIGRGSSILAPRRPERLDELLEGGDTREQFALADGSRTDRSRMGFAVLRGLQARGLELADVKRLVRVHKPGLAAYWERPDGDRLLEYDWRKVTGSDPRDCAADAVRYALGHVPRRRDQVVLLGLAALGDAPGVRRLSEATGYSLRTVAISLESLERSGHISKIGPKVGPGHRHAQRWRVYRPSQVYTYGTPDYRVAVGKVRELVHGGTPLKAVLGRVPDLHEALTTMNTDDIVSSADGEVVARGVQRTIDARARHETERAQYRGRLQRAKQARVPFLDPKRALEARRDRYAYRLSRMVLDEGEFQSTLDRAKRRLPGHMHRELLSIESPRSRHRRWLLEVRQVA